MDVVNRFDFLIFTACLLVLFPLAFVINSRELVEFLSIVLTATKVALLLVSDRIFAHFRLRLGPVI